MNRHTFTVSVDVPETSGDGWSKYPPDYSVEETGRALRRALHAANFVSHDGKDAVVEHITAVTVEE